MFNTLIFKVPIEQFFINTVPFCPRLSGNVFLSFLHSVYTSCCPVTNTKIPPLGSILCILQTSKWEETHSTISTVHRASSQHIYLNVSFIFEIRVYSYLFVCLIKEAFHRSSFIEMDGDRKLSRVHFDHRRHCFKQSSIFCEVFYSQRGWHNDQLQGIPFLIHGS